MVQAIARLAALAAPTLVILALAVPALAQQATARIPLDSEQVIGGIAIACTGVGQGKADPRWLAYPVQVEFALPGGDYLADEALSVIDHAGRTLASVSCEGPWILLRPEAPGDYTFKGWVPGAFGSRGGAFHIPAKGRSRLVLHFPGA
jgi:hypothetical protein